jgi:hypothetical protein
MNEKAGSAMMVQLTGALERYDFFRGGLVEGFKFVGNMKLDGGEAVATKDYALTVRVQAWDGVRRNWACLHVTCRGNVCIGFEKSPWRDGCVLDGVKLVCFRGLAIIDFAPLYATERFGGALLSNSFVGGVSVCIETASEPSSFLR